MNMFNYFGALYGALSTRLAKTVTVYGDAKIKTSTSTKNITAYGNAQISTSQSKFGGSSGAFDGNGDYLSIPSSSDFHFGSGDFTLRFWVRYNVLPSSGSYQVFFTRSNGGLGWYFALKNTSGTYSLESNITFESGKTLLINPTITTPNINQWYHYEICRYGNLFKVFVDGTQVGEDYTSSYTFIDNSQPIYIGMFFNNTLYFNGYLDDFEISKGIARHTFNFTPSTSAIVPDSYSKLLLNMDGANGSTTFDDSSGSSIVVPVFGTGMGCFDGIGDYLGVSPSSDFAFGTGDFTVECRFRTSITNSYQGLIEITNGTQNIVIYLGNVKNIAGSITGVTELQSTTNYLTADTWYHVALERASGTLRLYVNGVIVSSQINANTNIAGSFSITKAKFSTYLLNGLMDEVRISKVARFNGSFTPTTSAYTADSNDVLLLHMDGTDGSTTFVDSVT